MMASRFDGKLLLAGSLEKYKEYLSEAHLLFLVQEALEETPKGADTRAYIQAVAEKCKSGVVSVAFLAKEIDKECSLTPSPEEKESGVTEGRAEGSVNIDPDTGGADDQDDHAQDTELEEEGESKEASVERDSDMETEVEFVGVKQGDEVDEDDEQNADVKEEVRIEDPEIKKIIADFESGFFAIHRWKAATKPLVVPGDGYWDATHDIERIRTSTSDDFSSAMPMQMPTYNHRNNLSHIVPKRKFTEQIRAYHLCKRVAVSFDGKIYRATDAEIEAALQKEKYAPSTDAATYVKVVQEVRRRHEIERARESDSD